MTYTPDSPAVKRAEKTFLRAPGSALNGFAIVLSEHKRGLQDRLAATQAVNARQGAIIEDLIVERDDLADRLAAAQSTPAAVVLPEITDEDVNAAHRDGEVCHGVRVALATYRDRIAASLPVWQLAAHRARHGHQGRDALAGVTLRDLRAPKSGVAVRVEVDPRTIPAEPQPVDPDADVIEAMAAATARCDDYEWTHDLDESDRESYRAGARAALAAYRAHIADQEA